ncbi:MAG: hypothetical protein DIZ80_07710 [endosymbiont of Galathealinum brachiosum]|uniref:Uncharacterized protein n=1 Tax=endosymbiont of Galathealinum brachiosum TaxID=2200906 RepID=A0A370DGJ0_9GAMM|nr:MAG: hypothetical protein DIZ80_07710 [endosymbiont of Galathealinum brachiosum]
MSKIAVLINERQSEAIRMSSGITLMDDEVDLFFIDSKLDDSEEVEMMMEIAGEMELPMYSNVTTNEQMTQLSTSDIHTKLLDYDHIIAY